MAMICPSCRKELPDNASACAFCGVKFAPVSQSGYQTIPQQINSNMVSSDWRADPKEKIRYSLRYGFITSLPFSEDCDYNEVVITDKRLYYYVTHWLWFGKHRAEIKIDLEDITTTTITNTNPFLVPIFGAILFFLAFVFFIIAPDFLKIWLIMFVLFFPFVPLVLWLYLKRKFLMIEYAGGGVNRGRGVLYIDVTSYKIDSIRVFQKQIHLAKTEFKRTRNK